VVEVPRFSVALVQTPHYFYSPDPFERNLSVGRNIPNEGMLFYVGSFRKPPTVACRNTRVATWSQSKTQISSPWVRVRAWLRFLKDPMLALVQTPHYFYSPDPFERNLSVGRNIPNDLFLWLLRGGSPRRSHRKRWRSSYRCPAESGHRTCFCRPPSAAS
jgi:hypothetical protein